ncbi:MAG: pyridoxamine 5'-phosphate oxidase family protein [Hyphomicrobiaceae bacterium]
MSDPRLVKTMAELDALYGTPALGSILKELPVINAAYRAMIEAAPFCVLATSGPEGLDASPRGDNHGLVRVVDEKTLLLPDRRGNQRIDSLRNVVRDPRVGLLFLIPGVGETLRVNGRAELTTDPELCSSFAVDGKEPKCVLRITVEAVYFQCARAIARSRLWEPSARVDRKSLPSTGTLTVAARDFKGRTDAFDAAAYDAALAERQKATLY